jgi:peptide chain release factor 3
LETEYGAECRVETAPWTLARWLIPADGASAPGKSRESVEAPLLELPSGCNVVLDPNQNWVVLFPNDWSVRYFSERNPKVSLSASPL